MNYKQLPLVSLGLLAMGSFVNAQGGFVLCGDAAEKPAPEHKVVRPLSAPYFHEDSFVTTDLRAWYLQHDLDTIEGDVTVAALQVRLALTESLQLVAYKDGYTDFDGGALDGQDGWNDIGAGLKWAFLQDWENQLHAAVGVGYEFGFGDDEVLQDTDELRLWASVNKGFDRLHLGATVNYIIADDHSEGTFGNADIVTAHLHADYYLTEWLSPVVEVNGYFVQDAGSTDAVFSGVDAVSVGGGESEDTVTGVLGLEFRPFCQNSAFRVAYETELSDNVGLFGDRWTFSAVCEF
jgi:hypothetical protein